MSYTWKETISVIACSIDCVKVLLRSLFALLLVILYVFSFSSGLISEERPTANVNRYLDLTCCFACNSCQRILINFQRWFSSFSRLNWPFGIKLTVELFLLQTGMNFTSKQLLNMISRLSAASILPISNRQDRQKTYVHRYDTSSNVRKD